jgi:Ca2+-binding RTX toxin-like protein
MTQNLLSILGTYQSGTTLSSKATAYDETTQQLYVVNEASISIDILDGSNPSNPTLTQSVSLADFGGFVNSIAINNNLIAVAIAAADRQANGQVVFLNPQGEIQGSVEVGPLPDMLTFTPDGTTLLVANEGEPNNEYTTDPEGSISLIDVATQTVNTADFTAFNDQIEELRNAGVRIFGLNASVAQDVEPEYIAVTEDSSTAYITLQENNAVAVMDINSATLTDILPLGFKDNSVAGNGLDTSDRDDGINITNPANLFAMYQPDAISVYEAEGVTYLLTANEGENRNYDGFSEEFRIKDLILDPEAFPNAATLQLDENLGRLEVTNRLGDGDGDGDFDQLYTFGSRSFSIWQVGGDGLTLVFDSGDEFEQTIAQQFPNFFNSDNDENTFDTRSENRGSEPEPLEIATIEDKTYAFIGLERMGGVFAYDITDPNNPVQIQYINNRDFTIEPFDPDTEALNPAVGDLGPEEITYIGNNLLVVNNDISGSTTIYQITPLNNAPVLENSGETRLDPVDSTATENPGTLVSQFSENIVTDVDNDPLGIAVIAVDNTNGTWEYSLNNGATWTAFNTPTETTARLLAADATVRFIPNNNFSSGTVDQGITFRGWDGTSGVNGEVADTTENGGNTAFSSEVETASVRVNEGPPNIPPTVVEPIGDQAALVQSGFSLEVDDNFSDEDGDILTFTSSGLPPGISLNEQTGVIIGSTTTSGNFSVTVTADDGEETITDEFVLTVSELNLPDIPEIPPLPGDGDGDGGSEPPEIDIPIRPPNSVINSIIGNNQANSLTGTPENDELVGVQGDDTLTGLEANDNLYGNLEDDLLFARQGDDNLYGNDGNDTLFGGVGETLPDDNLSDIDFIRGGQGNDLLFGNRGEDTILGSEGDDTIYGGKDNDLIAGETGDDFIVGDLGNDTLVGGEGSDRFLLVATAGTDLIADFEPGLDGLSLIGLSFNQLNITTVNQQTQIQVTATGEILAIVSGITANQMGEENFSTFSEV